MTAESASVAAAETAAPTAAWAATAPGLIRARVLFACVVGNMMSFTPVVGITFGVFLLPMAKEFHWPRATLSGVMTLVAILTALLYPILGRIADRVGARGLIVWGSLALGLTTAALALAGPNVPLFYALFAAAGIAGAAPSTLLINRMIAQWFDKTRGAMLGVTAGVGNGVGASLMPIVAAALMSAFGWRGAYLGLGGLILFVSCPILATMLREAPHPADSARTTITGDARAPDLSSGLSLSEAARTRAFWLILTSIALAGGCISAATSHVIPILSDRGFGLAVGTAVVSVYALVAAAAQLVIGALLDRMRSPRAAAVLFVASAAGLLLLEHGEGQLPLVAAGVLLGIGIGAEYSILPYVISRYFGMKHFGAIAGVMYATVMLTQGVTPLLMDVVFDARRSYALALHGVEAGLLAAAALLASLGAYSRLSAPSGRVPP